MTTESLFLILGLGVTALAVWQIYKGWTTGVIINPLDPALPRNSKAEKPKAYWTSMAYYGAIIVVALAAALLYGR